VTELFTVAINILGHTLLLQCLGQLSLLPTTVWDSEYTVLGLVLLINEQAGCLVGDTICMLHYVTTMTSYGM